MIQDNLLQCLDEKGGRIEAVQSNQCNSKPRWFHLNNESVTGYAWLTDNTQISSKSLELLLSQDTRPRCFINNEDQSINLCLRGINLHKNAAPEDMISIRIWILDNTIVTCTRRHSQSLASIEGKLKLNKGPTSVQELLLEIIEGLADLTENFIEGLDTALDAEEDGIAQANFESFNPKMSLLRRQIATVKRFLTPQKEALDRLYRSKSTIFEEAFYESLYIQLDKFILVLENLDLLRERAIVLQEQFMGFISHQQNSRLYLLAIISAIFLPLTFLSGLLGMNVGGLPGLENPSAFWMVSAFCFVVALVLLVWFKRKNWF